MLRLVHYTSNMYILHTLEFGFVMDVHFRICLCVKLSIDNRLGRKSTNLLFLLRFPAEESTVESQESQQLVATDSGGGGNQK